MRPSFAHLAAIAATPFWLTGCDLALAGPFMPPILPGVGFPLTGSVVDANTRLPVGGATVQSGLGSTVTDANGHFSLYGGVGSHAVSVSRAGYTAETQGDVDPNNPGDLAFALTPLFPDASPPITRFVELSGQIAGLPTNQPAQVFFGDKTAAVTNGAYQLDFRAGAPGRLYTSVLAYGAVTGPMSQDPNGPQPFNYTTFYYEVSNWPLGDTIPQSRILHNVTAANPVPISPTNVSYKNLSGFNNVQTDILLDFGVVGSVPVARATGSNQSIPVPRVPGLKYDVIGTATDATGRLTSTVQITTNDPGRATFQLLSAPKITSPAAGSTGAGQRPTFSWVAETTAQVTYEVTLFEGDDSKPKWIGHTSATEIQYPAFSPGDINGGALRTDKKYVWNLRVLDVLGATQLPTSKDAPIHEKPYRVREREAVAIKNGFSL